MNDSLSFNVNLNNFNGPLEVLLDLAKSQKVDLEKISITILVDQFLDFIKSNEKINLDIASEYLLMATWLTYLKSKLLLPETDEEEFKALEVAEKLKLQLKKLELFRLLSDQMSKRKRLGKDIFMRGIRGKIKSIYSTKYSLTMFEIFKSYSSIIMSREFQKINIPKLPVFTADQGAEIIKKNIDKLNNWKDVLDLIPSKFKKSNQLKRTGIAGIFAASLELTREGIINLMQKKSFDKLLIKEKK